MILPVAVISYVARLMLAICLQCLCPDLCIDISTGRTDGKYEENNLATNNNSVHYVTAKIFIREVYSAFLNNNIKAFMCN